MNKLFKKWSTPIEARKFGPGRDIGYFLFLCIAVFLYFFITYIGEQLGPINVERWNDFQKSWAVQTLVISVILVLLSPNKNKFIANLIVAGCIGLFSIILLISTKTDYEIAVSKNTRESISTKYLEKQCRSSGVSDSIFECERNKTTTGWNGKEVTYKIKYTGSVDRVGEYFYPKGHPRKHYDNDGNNKSELKKFLNKDNKEVSKRKYPQYNYKTGEVVEQLDD